MLTIKTFKDKSNKNKNFYHVKILGFKFRVATNTRGMFKATRFTYATGRGRVVNVGSKYICFMRGV